MFSPKELSEIKKIIESSTKEIVIMPWTETQFKKLKNQRQGNCTK